MKKSVIYIITYLLIVVFYGCTTNNNEMSIDSMLNKKHNYFNQRYNVSIYNVFWTNINKVDRAVYDLLAKGKITDLDIDNFRNKLGDIYSYNEIDLNALKKNKDNKFLFRNDIKLVQYSLYSYYESLIFIDQYSFDMVRPIVLSEDNKIKLGETYKCEIYLAAASRGFKPLVVIDKDTLVYNEKEIPFYEIKPNKRGIYSLKGKMLSLGQFSDTSFYDFGVNFTVE